MICTRPNSNIINENFPQCTRTKEGGVSTPYDCDNDVRAVDNNVIAAKSHFWQWQRAELGQEGVTVTVDFVDSESFTFYHRNLKLTTYPWYSWWQCI